MCYFWEIHVLFALKYDLGIYKLWWLIFGTQGVHFRQTLTLNTIIFDAILFPLQLSHLIQLF